MSDFELARILNMFKKKRPKDTSLRQYEKSQERNRHTILCIIQDAWSQICQTYKEMIFHEVIYVKI